MASCLFIVVKPLYWCIDPQRPASTDIAPDDISRISPVRSGRVIGICPSGNKENKNPC